MSERLHQAEAAVERARSDLAADMDDVKGWIAGATPLMRCRDHAPRFRRGPRRYGARGEEDTLLRDSVANTVRVNPLPLFFAALGAGWLLQALLRSTARSYGRRRR